MPRAKEDLSESESVDSDSGPEDVSYLQTIKCWKNNNHSNFLQRNKPPPNKKVKPEAKEQPTSWVLEKQRQVRINEFRGRKLIDIREFYEKNGETLPGKKGISLSVEQWKKLLGYADEINRALQIS